MNAQAELSSVQTSLAEREEQLEAVKRKAEQLAQELELIRLARKGPTSQRFVPDGQTLLPFTTGVEPPPRAPVETPQSDAESTEEAGKVKRPGSKRPKRRNRQDFHHLDSRPVHVPAADQACRSCGEPLVKIGVAESFRVEWIPGKFVVHDIARDKCACPNCPSEGVLTAAGPYALDRSLAGNGLVARVLVDKFADHIPAHRQAKRMGRESFEVGSHTLSAWIGSAGQLRKGRMWVFTDQEHVFYAFTDTKEGTHPTALLDGYAGSLLLVDGGSEFNDAVRTLGLDRAELMLRQTVVGRKNGLFARSEGGAHAAATLEPLIGSCTLQGIDSWFYLRDVLDRIQDDPANRLGELTPRNWAATRQGHTGELG